MKQDKESLYKADIAQAIGYSQGLGHPNKYLESRYPELSGHEHSFTYIGTEVSDADALTPRYHVYKCSCGEEQRAEVDFDVMERERVEWLLVNM